MFQIFFPSLGVTVHRQRYDYSASQFVSEIGGAAGLVVGASVISIVQILDDMIASLCFRYQKYLCRVRHVDFPHPFFLTDLKPRLLRIFTTTPNTTLSTTRSTSLSTKIRVKLITILILYEFYLADPISSHLVHQMTWMMDVDMFVNERMTILNRGWGDG